MGRITLAVEEGEVGRRIDRYLSEKIEGCSRSELQRAIRAGCVDLNGEKLRLPSYRLRSGDCIVVDRPEQRLLTPAPIEIEVLYEDSDIIVVDKSPGLVVHPGAGEIVPTLVEGLLVDRDLPVGDDPIRPGIVHRLDKDTSGLIVVAKTDISLSSLKEQFAARTIGKVYLAVVTGRIVEEEGLIDAPIGRDPVRPRRMAINPQGRAAQTEFHVLRRADEWTLLRVHPRTGRTHQIRVHLRYIDHPVVGDSIYGKHEGDRLMLHSWRIELSHPRTGSPLCFETAIPEEFPAWEGDRSEGKADPDQESASQMVAGTEGSVAKFGCDSDSETGEEGGRNDRFDDDRKRCQSSGRRGGGAVL
ncbi:RluA family pseudouridine synthase [Candidatus Bipolaricaulota bacterium]|nr:RluA family pseudouridine synthase [Candidatus Bipolaricaulota bacterium]